LPKYKINKEKKLNAIKIPWEDLTLKQKAILLKENSLDSLYNLYQDKNIAFFKKEQKILNLKPRFKDNDSSYYKDIKNPPSLEIIKNRSLLISPEMALIEFLDNIFDNYIKNLKNGNLDQSLKIELIFYESNNQNTLLIRENSGGIHPDDILPLVKTGKSGRDESETSIGTWGEAFLYSCYSLGSEVIVYSFHENGKPFSIPINQDFYNNEEWVLKSRISNTFDGIKNLDKGWTVFEFNNVYKYTTNEIELYEDLKSEIEDTYWKKASEIYDMGYNVSIDIIPYFSKKLEVEFDFFQINRAFSHYPYCLPIFIQDYKLSFNDESGKKQSLLVDAYCGINPFEKNHKLAKFKGVSMWGNGRLFEKNRKDSSVGYNLTSTGIRLSQRQLFNHLSILLFFESKDKKLNRYIPWKIPTKKGFNSESILKKKIVEFISLLVKRCIYPLDHLYGGNRFIFEIFSYDFIERSEEEKSIYLLEEIKKAQNRNVLYPDIDWKALTEKKRKLSTEDEQDLLNILRPFFSLRNEHLFDIEKFNGDDLDSLRSKNEEFNEAIKRFSTVLGKSKEDPGYIKKMIEHFLKSGFLPLSEEDEEDVEEIQTSMEDDKAGKEKGQSIEEDNLHKKFVPKIENEIKTIIHEKEFKPPISQDKPKNEIIKDVEVKTEKKETLSLKKKVVIKKPSKPKKEETKIKIPKKQENKSKDDISLKLKKSVKTSKQDLKLIREQKVTVSVKLELEKDTVNELKKKLELSPNTSAKKTVHVLIANYLKE